MDAQLTIDDETFRAAERLAELTGQSVPTVVAKALRAELEREEGMRHRFDRLARIKALAQDVKAHMTPPFSSADPQELYGSDGLPQ